MDEEVKLELQELIRQMKEKRIEMGLSALDVGKMIDMSPSYISKLENGERQAPSWVTVERLRRALLIEDVDKYMGKEKFFAPEATIEDKISRISEILKMYAKRKDASFREIINLLLMMEDVIYNN